MSDIRVEARQTSVEEYQELRASTGWAMLADQMVAAGLRQSLFAVVASTEGQVVGMGRIVGDGAIYFYIQDVIVLPEWKGRGIGASIMRELEDWLARHAPENAFIGLMAAEGVASFYHHFGYRERKSTGPGMFKTV